MTKQLKTPRQIRYNFLSEPNPERHHWTILIVNDKRTIHRVKQKFMNSASPLDEVSTITEGRIPKSHGLRYLAFSATTFTNPNLFPWNKVYKGPVSRDVELYLGESQDRLSKYIDSEMSRLSR